MMKGQRIAEACGIRFHKDLHKRFNQYNSDLDDVKLPDYWYIEHSSIDGKIRLFAPSSSNRLHFITDLHDVEKSIKLVKMFIDLATVKCYDDSSHTFEILSGSFGDFAFASVGQPKLVTAGFYNMQATINPASMSNPIYDTFWYFDRAKYRNERKFGIVKYNDRFYVPFIGVDNIMLLRAKKVISTFCYSGELTLADEPDFHPVRSIDNFGKYH